MSKYYIRAMKCPHIVQQYPEHFQCEPMGDIAIKKGTIEMRFGLNTAKDDLNFSELWGYCEVCEKMTPLESSPYRTALLSSDVVKKLAKDLKEIWGEDA